MAIVAWNVAIMAWLASLTLLVSVASNANLWIGAVLALMGLIACPYPWVADEGREPFLLPRERLFGVVALLLALPGLYLALPH